MNILEQAKKLLKENNQDKLLNMMDKMSEDKREKLAQQIIDLDFVKLNNLYEETKEKPEILEKKLEHIKYVDEYRLSEDKSKLYAGLGEEIIKNNQYAVVTMAGGQGTRLGHKGPKGTFKIDVKPEPKYLFQILAENLERANKKYGVILPWYIMTSTENNKETVEFFKNNNYFGYDESKVKFFIQGNLPLLFKDGQLVLDKDYSIKLAADGNGCIYKAMAETGIISEMREKGIKWIFIGSVDNVLLNMVDPILIGLTIKQNNLIGSKSVVKANAQEKVGVFGKVNGKTKVIEYTELPKEMQKK